MVSLKLERIVVSTNNTTKKTFVAASLKIGIFQCVHALQQSRICGGKAFLNCSCVFGTACDIIAAVVWVDYTELR